jgi:hypothetical protein
MRTEKQTLLFSALAITSVFAVLFCYLAFAAGQDANWDFYNYHYYNAYAFLNERFWYDIQAAQRQTFLSPFLDIPFYWLTEKYGILSASLATAIFQSLQAPALFILSYCLVKGSGFRQSSSIWISLTLTIIALLAPLNYQQIGASYGDSTTATLVLAGLAFIALAFSKSAQTASPVSLTRLTAIAGLLFGLAVGLKLTNGPFVVAAMIFVGFLPGTPRVRARIIFVFCLSVALAFVLSYGYWGWFLYDQLKNPIFPQFNHVFQSDYISPVAFTDERFKATGLLELLLYPLYFNIFSGDIGGRQFLDIRVPIAYVLAVGSALAVLVMALVRRQFSWSRQPAGLLFFWLVAYFIWLLLFSFTRYALVLEVLAPLVVFSTIAVWKNWHWPARILTGVALLPMVAASVLLPMNDQSWGPRAPWTNGTFEVQLPYDDLEAAMVVVHGGQAMAFLIPTAPVGTRFIRVNSNLFYIGFHSLEERYDNALGRRLKQEIREHQGPLFTLMTDAKLADVDAELVIFGLRRETDTCRPVLSKGGPDMKLCRAHRDDS